MKKVKSFGMNGWKKKIVSNAGQTSDEGVCPFLYSNNKGSEKYARKAKEAALQDRSGKAINGKSKEDIRRMEEESTPVSTWRSRNRKDIHKPGIGSRADIPKK